MGFKETVKLDRPDGEFNLSCEVSKKCVKLTMQDIAKKLPAITVTHSLDDEKSMTVTQEGGPLAMKIVAGFSVVDTIKSDEDEAL